MAQSNAEPGVESSEDSPPAANESAGSSAVPEYAGVRATRSVLSLGERYGQLPYMQRYLPEDNLWEVGMFFGVLFPSANHNLKVQVLPREEYSPAAMQLGGRIAYFPLSYLGFEAEAFAGGGSTATTNYSALFYSVRGHVLAQLPFWSVTPFALLGVGTLGASSETMGHDRDPAIHFGGGLKLPFNHRVSGRLDVRDIMSQKGKGAENGKQTHYPEFHMGLSFAFERTPPKIPTDRDFDGLYDDEDRCPDEGALTRDGCVGDKDGDSVKDSVDECPALAGEGPSGCPNLDPDGDGVLMPADRCPEQMGIAPDGCPDEDPDHDGFLGDKDKCPDQPEKRNGFEDEDGCPDELPAAVAGFAGVIEGVNFRKGTAEIEKSSFATLDGAVEVLQKYPSIRIEVSGHTSSEGTEKRNTELSDQRAAAVRQYMLDKGVEGDRIVARGAGSSEPATDNATNAGREQNRRIEFKVLSQP